MNQETILCLDDDAGRHEVFTAAMRDYPCWPDDLTTDDLLDLLGDDVSAVCPYRAAKGRG